MPDHHVATPTEQAITTYLDEVARHLTGPRRSRAAIIDELRDGLATAVHTRRAHGSEPDEVVGAVLREFGPPEVVAAAFADELAIARARHTVASYLATGPLIGMFWLLALAPPLSAHGPAAIWDAVPAAPAAGAAAITGVLILAATGPPGRHLPISGHHTIHCALAVVAAAAVADLVMLTYTASAAALPVPTLGGLAIAASMARLGCSVLAAALCLRSHPDAGRPG